MRWPELALDVLTVARALGKPAILDGDVAPVETLERLAPAATHIIFSEPAAASLTETNDVPAMLPLLHARYPQTFIAVTAGPAGCWWTEPNDPTVHFQSTMAIDAVDTLAAGDVFHGTFALTIAEGIESRAAIQLSSVAAALKCMVLEGEPEPQPERGGSGFGTVAGKHGTGSPARLLIGSANPATAYAVSIKLFHFCDAVSW